MAAEHPLDLPGRDVFATHAHAVGAPTNEEQIAVGILARHVAGVQTTIAQRLGAGLGVVQVTGQEHPFDGAG
ncbi:hypothetical protein D3C75_1358990 [compost metagenome]